MNIGEKIRNARKMHDYSQEELANGMGISVQAVSKWECGQSCPDIACLPNLADYLSVSLDYLLRDDLEADEGNKQKLDLPNDGKLRIVQYIGNCVMDVEENQSELFFCMPENQTHVEIEIRGNAHITGNINGNLAVSLNASCKTVNGDVSAGGSVTCEKINGEVYAGGSVHRMM